MIERSDATNPKSAIQNLTYLFSIFVSAYALNSCKCFLANWMVSSKVRAN